MGFTLVASWRGRRAGGWKWQQQDDDNDEDEEQPRDADVVIVGGGVSGSAAAAFLSSSFAPSTTATTTTTPSIVIIEKGSELGGVLRGKDNSAGLWRPRTIEDISELDVHINYESHPTPQASAAFSKRELEFMLNDSTAAIETLQNIGAIDGFQLADDKAYYGETKMTNFHRPIRSHGEKLYAFLVTTFIRRFSGVAGRNVCNAMPLGADDGLLMLPSFVRRLIQYVEDKSKVRPVFNTEVTALVAAASLPSSLRRWRVETTAGTFATDHVIFASGGFAANQDAMKSRGLEAMVPHYWNSINSGVIEKIAAEHGWLPCPRDQQENRPVWYSEAIDLGNGQTQALLFLNGDSMMVVNRKGQRVYNEKWPYARRGKVCLEQGGLIAIMDGQNLTARAQAVKGGDPAHNVFFPLEDTGVYMHAKSPEELASKLEQESLVEPGFAQAFSGQLDRFNGFAGTGVDSEFGRESYARYFEPPSSPVMSPIDTSDLYAVVLLPSSLDTCSGPSVDEHSHVRYRNNSPVAGVYAVGNAASSLTRGLYLAAGVPSFSGITQAYRAASSIRQEIDDLDGRGQRTDGSKTKNSLS